MKRLRTLRIRFALWTAGVLFAALALFGLFVYANTSHNLSMATNETLRLAALQLTAEVELRNGEVAFVEASIEDPHYAQLREQGFSMRVLNLHGQTVQESGPYTSFPPPRVDFAVPNQPGEFTTTTDPVTREPLRVYTVPIVESGQAVGMLQVAQNLNDLHRTLNVLLASLLVVGPLMVLVAGGSGYFLAARALAPIDDITRTARQISANDLSARLNLTSTDDEVGRLAATFDSMLARLDDAFRRERQFTADASHELRTPLAAMQTIIGSTLARRRSPAEYEEALEDLSHETAQMRTLTEGLLHLARDDASRPPAHRAPVDVALLLKDVVDSLRPLAEDKDLTLIDHVPEEGLVVTGDSDGLARLFVNLLDNAIKYTEQGCITVAATRDANNLVVVTVSDTGVGIPAEQVPYIFHRFYRVDTARSKDGIGLGLAIARTVARAHAGDITVESTPGQGTTFTVQLAVM